MTLTGSAMFGLLGSVGSAVAQLGDADVELDIRRVDVPQILQPHAVRARVAREDEPRPTHADRHVRLDRLLDLEPIRRDGHLAIGVGHLHVIQTKRCAGEVKLGEDLGAVDEIRDERLIFGEAGHHQLDDRIGLKLGAADRGGDVGARTPLVDLHVGDR